MKLSQVAASKRFDKSIETTAMIFGAAIVAVLWYCGAFFTLVALTSAGIAIGSLRGFKWLIPLGVSFLEVRFYPGTNGSSYKKAIFGTVALLDVGSTVYGLSVWAAGRELPLFTGVLIPVSGPGLFIPVIVAAIVFTFGPEAILIRIVRDLIKLWEL